MISYTDVNSRLVVVLRFELAVAVFCLYADLRQGVIVKATGENLLACIFF